MSAFCGWALNVNKIISDSTAITVGENAVYEESLESGGLPRSRQKNSVTADSFSVTMNFSINKKDEEGYSEIDRFWRWYKYVHKYGTVPFEFPAILLNSNHAIGYSTEETYYKTDGVTNIPQTEYYKITSAVNGSKSGEDIQVNMTWVTYSTNIIVIPEEAVTPDTLTVINSKCVKVNLLDFTALKTQPVTNAWSVDVSIPNSDSEAIVLINSYFDGRAVYLHLKNDLPESAEWATITVSYDGVTSQEHKYKYENGEIVNYS